MKNKTCSHIESALRLSQLAGISIKNITEGWTNARKVFHMSNKLTAELKRQIEQEVVTLEYWKEIGDSHYEPSEGFFCNECKEGISFPVKK